VNHRLLDADELMKYTRQGVLYQHFSWWKSVVEGVGYDCFGLATTFQNLEIISIFYQTQKGPFRLVGSPLRGCFTDFTQPMGVQELESRVLTDMLISQFNFIKANGASYIEWRFSGNVVDLVKFTDALGVEAEEKGTFILEIEPDEQLMWNKMESRGRNMVRKAEKSGVTIKHSAGGEGEIDLFYEMLKATFAKSGKTPSHPKRFYESLISNLGSVNRVLVLSAEINGKIEAMGIFPHDENRIQFLSGTSTAEGGRYAANNLIQWNVIKYAMEKRMRIYDLGGTGIPAIDKFKASFGGKPYSYYQFIWRTPTESAAEKIFFMIRPVFERTISNISRRV